MNKPNLDNVREAFVEIKRDQSVIGAMKMVAPWVLYEYNQHNIRWFCVLVHEKGDGCVPNMANGNLYIHIRFEDVIDRTAVLPWFFEMERRVPVESMREIAGLDLRLVTGSDIEMAAQAAWMMIGLQTLVFFEIIDHHRSMPLSQLRQWLHYWDNMAGRNIFVPKNSLCSWISKRIGRWV